MCVVYVCCICVKVCKILQAGRFSSLGQKLVAGISHTRTRESKKTSKCRNINDGIKVHYYFSGSQMKNSQTLNPKKGGITSHMPKPTPG
jgi:hypothetical protein